MMEFGAKLLIYVGGFRSHTKSEITFYSCKMYSDDTKLASFRNLNSNLMYKIWGEILKKEQQ